MTPLQPATRKRGPHSTTTVASCWIREIEVLRAKHGHHHAAGSVLSSPWRFSFLTFTSTAWRRRQESVLDGQL